MSNPYLWAVLAIGGILIYLKIRHKGKVRAESDDQFLSRKLRGAQIFHFSLLAVLTFGSGYFFVLTVPQFREYWYISLGALVFLAISGYFLFVNLRRGKHPVAVALQTNPSQLTKMEFQSYSVYFLRLAVWAHFHTSNSILLMQLSDTHEKEKLTEILLTRAPHLFAGDQGSAASDKTPQTAEEKAEQRRRNMLGLLASAVMLILLVTVFWFGSDKPSKAGENISIEDYVDQLASELNVQLPVELDEWTRLDSALRENLTLTFRYTMLQAEEGTVDSEILKNQMLPQLTRSACTDERLKPVLRGGYGVGYAYFYPSGSRASKITITAGNCTDP